jgi:hypothetical protein
LKDTVNIYWAPFVSGESPDWNMLYSDPENIFDNLKKQSSPGIKSDSFLTCPAVSDKFKKVYVLKNTLDSTFNFDQSQNITSLNKDSSYVNLYSIRKPTLKNTNSLVYKMQWIFFADEPLVADFTAPYFHQPKYLNYGSVIPGKMDIGKWFRPYNTEIVTWEDNGFIEFKENEPLAYVSFNTDKHINLIRFNMNENLMKYAESCMNSPSTYGRNISLSKRYERFKNSKMNEMILKEIKNSALEGKNEKD